jgi:hypothetical protein
MYIPEFNVFFFHPVTANSDRMVYLLEIGIVHIKIYVIVPITNIGKHHKINMEM